MMVIVLNTSALSAFTRIDGFTLLKNRFNKVIVPQGVIDEFSVRFRKPPKWIEVLALDDDQIYRANKLGLGKGENEAIILALYLDALLIIEDKKARKTCDQLNVKKVCTYGIIIQAFVGCFIERPEFVDFITHLKTDLYYSDKLISFVLSSKKPRNVA